jgi:spectinomycin phosphotransferase
VDLLGRVRDDFGIPLIGVRPTGLGADARAELFRGDTADGTAYAVKTSTAPQPGLVVADFLATRGVPGVPAPLRTRSGALTSVTGDGSAVSVVPWVEGSRAIDTGLDEVRWRGFGEVLGAVHATAPAAPLVGGSDRSDRSDRSGRDASAVLLVDEHDPRVEVRRARGFAERLRSARVRSPKDPLLDQLAALWAEHGEQVLAVADLAVSTAIAPAWDGAAPVICHADPHHGNLLLEHSDSASDPAGSRGVWLVDWDDAVLAPREADLIFVVGGVYSFAPITPAEIGWFFDGYSPSSSGEAPADVDETRLTYYRSVRALTDFLDFADDVLYPRNDRAVRASSLRIAAGALSPEGLVTTTLSGAARDVRSV